MRLLTHGFTLICWSHLPTGSLLRVHHKMTPFSAFLCSYLPHQTHGQWYSSRAPEQQAGNSLSSSDFTYVPLSSRVPMSTSLRASLTALILEAFLPSLQHTLTHWQLSPRISQSCISDSIISPGDGQCTDAYVTISKHILHRKPHTSF